MSVSERELLEACRKGRDSAFEELVNRHKMKAYSLAFFIIGNEADALDVSQEAFIKMYRNLHRFRGESGLGTWLHRIVYNLCMDFLRSRGRKTELPYRDEVRAPEEKIDAHPSGEPNPLRGLMRSDVRRHVRAAINSLPPKLKSVLVLREIESLSYAEIAGAVGCSKGTVMSRLHYARKKLRKKLAPVLNIL